MLEMRTHGAVRDSYLGVEVIAVAVAEPEQGVVAVRQRVGRDPRGGVVTLLRLPSGVAARRDARHLPRRSQVELEPLIS